MLPLSPQESRVLELYDQGLEYKHLAERLVISINTVKTYAHNIIVKTCPGGSLRQAAWLRRMSIDPKRKPAPQAEPATFSRTNCMKL